MKLVEIVEVVEGVEIVESVRLFDLVNPVCTRGSRSAHPNMVS